MTPDDARLVLLEHQITQTIPGFEMRWKDRGPGSGWQKFIGKVMFFNRGYLTGFVSTFGSRVYWTSRVDFEANPRWSFKVLAHEYVHLWDAKQTKGWFSFSYIMPQLFVLLGLLAVFAVWFSSWWLMALSALVCALPLPAYWRMKWEYRGYTMSMACNAWKHGDVQDSTIDKLVAHFTSGEYYFMWPFKRAMKRRLEAAVTQIHNGDVMTWGKPFQHVKVITDLSDEDALATASKVRR